MSLRLSTRLATVTSAGALLAAVAATPVAAGSSEPAEDGLIEADDLSGDWEEGPPDEDDDELDDEAADIESCEGILEITDKLDQADHLDGPTFALADQEIKSGVGVTTKKLAKRAVKIYSSGDGADCFEELLASNPITAGFEVLTDSGDGPDIGDGSAFIGAVLTGEDPTTGKVVELAFQLVMIRAGNQLAIYEYQSEGEGANSEDFFDAVDAAGERFAEAA